ncbi:hypothetical protein MPF_0540 [Methanohalophilus portucalensis FDF-1]|uniref:Uncharacterized protein n=1 Tax=Methanohalophilus portucalensis FDF-1 TaxID=523843 RepID=A0A1L9C5E0_9EURY|nr:hypothetical protein MPF_0540 [Methanohalophilus portucalensis FDF-1]
MAIERNPIHSTQNTIKKQYMKNQYVVISKNWI